MARHARTPQHARGKHAKRNPLTIALVTALLITAVLVVAPYLFGLGLVIGLLGGWMKRGLSKL